MRRTLAAAVLAAATALPLLPGLPASADFNVGPSAPTPAPAADSGDQAQQAQQALATVAALLDGPAARAGRARTADTPEADLTLALRDLYIALPRLSGDDREQAEAYLARPTDGSSDRFGDGYSVPAAKKCGGNFCVHYVTSTADAPPSLGWVNYALGQMNQVWKHEVKRMGYRKPLSDKPLGSRNGGNGKFDVYLKDIGGRGLYGYCAPEAGLRGKKYKWRAISYCVLDNDFARAQFGTAPKPTLRVTAAHEFFHAVQFSYDYGEDRWFMESTATWMEERYADKVDDNRQYLPASQVRLPYAPLDLFSSTGSYQYGNWVFWEYLGKRFGQGFVRSVWSATAPQRNGSNTYAINAVKRLTKKRGGFLNVYRTFAAANLFPQRAYPEGKAWPNPVITANLKLGKARKYLGGRATVNHLSSVHVRLHPDTTLTSKRWKLRVKVDGPGKGSSPSVVVSVKRKGGPVTRTVVRLSKKGAGKVMVPFSRKQVKNVTVTVVNASTRFACYRADPSADPQFSCQGNAKDDGKVFGLKFWAVKTKR